MELVDNQIIPYVITFFLLFILLAIYLSRHYDVPMAIIGSLAMTSVIFFLLGLLFGIRIRITEKGSLILSVLIILVILAPLFVCAGLSGYLIGDIMHEAFPPGGMRK